MGQQEQQRHRFDVPPGIPRAIANSGTERLTERQLAAVDALVTRYGDAHVRVHESGVAAVFHVEHPYRDRAWYVNEAGDVAEWSAHEPPVYNLTAERVMGR
jgi:hypothetical protein